MNHDTLGQRLRSVREALPASLYQASRETRIRVDFIEAMERDNFRFLSGPAYVKGMLRAYSRWLRLDEEAVAAEFDELYGGQRELPIRRILEHPATQRVKWRRPNWLVAAVVATGGLLLLSLIGVMNPSSDTSAPPPIASAGSPRASELHVADATDEVQLAIVVTGARSWVRVLQDDQPLPVFEGTLFSGSARTFTASDHLRVTIGDLGAVSLTLNGRNLGVAGADGEARTLTFTRDGGPIGRG